MTCWGLDMHSPHSLRQLVMHNLEFLLVSVYLHYTTCAKYFPVLPCTAKFAESTLHTTLHYNACTMFFPVLLCTTRLPQVFPILFCTTTLAQSSSQFYFVLQDFRKVLPILLCTTTLAQNSSQYYFVLQDLYTSQYYFVLQNLYKILPSTRLTAQGDGGSFKDRKPIGEVSCANAWMAEQTEQTH